jgi:hypothetical protein
MNYRTDELYEIRTSQDALTELIRTRSAVLADEIQRCRNTRCQEREGTKIQQANYQGHVNEVTPAFELRKNRHTKCLSSGCKHETTVDRIPS